jgi:hypothetical protein
MMSQQRCSGPVVSPIIEYVDVEGVVRRVDVDAVVQRIDVEPKRTVRTGGLGCLGF